MRSFHDFIACSACHRDYLLSSPPSDSSDPPQVAPTTPLPFYLTLCHHTICQTCLFSTKPAPQPLEQVRLPCPACQTITPLALLVLDDPSNEMSTYFGDLTENYNKALMASKFQIENLMDQVSYLKPKCLQQKKSITRLLNEVKKVKAYKTENEQLRSENASLQAQLRQGSLPRRESIPIHHDSAEDFGGSHDQLNGGYSQAPISGQGYREEGGNSRKRRAVGPSDQNDGYGSIYSSTDSQHSQGREASYDQLRPTRLTLTPASRANHHLHHWTSSQSIPEEQENGLPPINGIKTSESIHLSGTGDRRRSQSDSRASSRMSVAANGNSGGRRGGGATSAGGSSIREHLSNFAYTPSASRASERPASSLPEPPRSQPADYGPHTSPMIIHNSHRHQQQDFYPTLSQNSEEDRRAMPPPPLPINTSRQLSSSTPLQHTRPFVPNSQSLHQSTPRSTPRQQTPISTPQHQHQQFSSSRNTPQSSQERRFGGGGGGSGNAMSASRLPFRPSG
ncbi:hypothetical protein JCM3765_001583 [Sporobolomyces pararoseus]